ncbi:1,4-alpha-glucan branching protein domain-containing protein [Paenibacillus alba]|uniref:DUF1957 domain-containing protein n=1 Tax=Paenibacillus alba TaxID=1197127 RepID=A0ABU6G805_9BACL|nr:1,4-alpha-glucan branching protein domain-containing protein [Paenibacillus alba]MEC0230287.1 DUF1957 domain-containing protein [Paenibacillus alba]
MSNPHAHGYVAFLLHAHIPYVRHEKDDITLEERWFFEAVVDSYLPLIEMMDRLLEEDIPFQLTLSLSPPLLAMLADSTLQQRLRKHLESLCELSQREVIRLWGHADFSTTARQYADHFHRLMALYDRLRGDLIRKFRSLRSSGCLELITCAATHAFLPLIKNDAALRAQLEAAAQEFRRHFGSAPAGIWLPECGYTPAIEPHLQALDLRYFVVDAHAHALAVEQMDSEEQQKISGLCVPLRTQSGACAFARDLEAGAQVWSAEVGYPSDADYREYYRDIGYDLGHSGGAEWEYLKPYVLPDGARIHTGFKYYRVTGAAVGDAKEPYHPARASQKAQQHAEHFVASRVAQLSRLARAAQTEAGLEAQPAQPPVIVCPYDAELFGHWWYEGHQWLEAVLRGLAAAQDQGVVVSTTTLGGYAAAHAPTTEAKLPVSSWGRGGYAEVWLQPRSQWVHPQLHAAEDRLVLAAQKHPAPKLLSKMQLRALNQAARELMLAQSSDWTFILDAQTVTEYAVKRIETHLAHLHQLLQLVEDEASDLALSEIVIALERKSPFLPELNYQAFQPNPPVVSIDSSLNRSAEPASPLHSFPSSLFNLSSLKTSSSSHLSIMDTHPASSLRILMLAWEYPPHVIGGLARAVCDLSRQLARSGHEVHVITCLTTDCVPYAYSDGVHIHRAEVLESIGSVHFLDWVFQMNIAFLQTITRLSEQGLQFDLIHAHDWLVFYAANECKTTLQLPLIATIHATEHGRNQGKLETHVQQRIHLLENKLANRADHLIVCSLYMQQEVMDLFQVPEHKLSAIPNGVMPFLIPADTLLATNPLLSDVLLGGESPILVFLGRLVYEKGVHVLISAMRLVLKRIPQAKLVIAGSGPELEGLQQLAASLGDRVSFVGFLEETDKNQLLHKAELCIFPSLYEPFGLVALEAMASGTPVIVSDTGGLAEIVDHPINGCKVKPGDAPALAKVIVSLLQDPMTAANLTSDALSKVSSMYNWELISTLTIEVYSKLIFFHDQETGIFRHQKEIIK